MLRATAVLLSLLGHAIGPQWGITHVAAVTHHDPAPAESPAERAGERLDAMSPADRDRVEATMAAADADERPYVVKVVAAGHNAGEVASFAQLIRGKKPHWLHTHLDLLDPDGSGWVDYRSAPVQQPDDTSCGPMTILMARAMADPLYALYLTTGDSTVRADAAAGQFQARLTAEEHRIHAETNRFWPQRLGSTPLGMSNELNRYADALGTHYRPRLANRSALADAADAAGNGHPVPVLIGDWIPHHYILLIGRVGADLLYYEPGYATVGSLNEQNFLHGKLDVIGFHRIYAVVTPS
ncbi:hypothetical protein [Kribbella jiaozuonensis]|uniref:Uncharacterized protein n=1 Tax=Kribbella jiaozuonensis TaxID=2575441 RepID=A0A4U3LKM9_9ACTN|nr:hypothetical protein [Kribbella jiaozuonensis]TKK76140.1 hypothetical protein FDA38_27370 [Kribbella jiaozuonensis]